MSISYSYKNSNGPPLWLPPSSPASNGTRLRHSLNVNQTQGMDSLHLGGSREKKAKPTDYRGPYQKVCSYHGWWSHKNNHDDAGCRYLQSKKAAAYNFDLMNDDEELPDSSMEMDYEDSSQIEDPLQYCTWPESPSALHISTKTPTDVTTLSLEGHTSGAKELEWLMDSGAKYHLCCKRYMYTTYSEFDTPIQMKGVGQGAVALGWGNVPLIIEKDNGATPIGLTKVLCTLHDLQSPKHLLVH